MFENLGIKLEIKDKLLVVKLVGYDNQGDYEISEDFISISELFETMENRND